MVKCNTTSQILISKPFALTVIRLLFITPEPLRNVLLTSDNTLTLIRLLFTTPEPLRNVLLTPPMNLFAMASMPRIRSDSGSLPYAIAIANYLRTHKQCIHRLRQIDLTAQKDKGQSEHPLL